MRHVVRLGWARRLACATDGGLVYLLGAEY